MQSHSTCKITLKSEVLFEYVIIQRKLYNVLKILATVGFAAVGGLDRPFTQRWRGRGVLAS